MSFHRPALKNITRKSTVVLTAAAFAVISSSHTVKENANFSGDWTLNEQKSSLGEMGGRMIAKKIKIMQTGDGLTTDKTSSFNGEERKTSEKLNLDGKESENTVFNNSKRKSTANWSDDGQTLTVSSTTAFERNGETMEIKGIEIWKLSDGGKTLSIESTSTSPRGTFSAKGVYDKS